MKNKHLLFNIYSSGNKMESNNNNNKDIFKDIVDLDELFGESIDAYTNELKISEELYNEVKKHYDKVMTESVSKYIDYTDGGKEKTRENPRAFATQQLTNLVSLRSHIGSTIKDRFNIQKEKAVLTIRLQQIIGGDIESDDSTIINQLVLRLSDNPINKKETKTEIDIDLIKKKIDG